MKTFQRSIILGLLVVLGASASFAQVRRATDRQMRTLLDRIETRTDVFRRQADSYLSRINDSPNADRMNNFINDFENATDALSTAFDQRGRTYERTQDVLMRATAIDQFVRGNRMPFAVTSQWTRIRTDLNTLARYDGVAAWNWNQRIDDTGTVPGGTIPYTATDSQLRALLVRLESNTDTFRRQIDSAMDRSVWDNSRNEDNLGAFVEDFENATDRLRRNFDERRSAVGDVNELLSRASYIDQFVRRSRLSRNTESNWTSIRTDLNTLARYYRTTWNYSASLPPFSPVYPGTVNPGTGLPYTATDAELKSLFVRLERNTDLYRRQIDSALDRPRWNNTSTEYNLGNYAEAFENATDRLRQNFESRNSVIGDVNEVLTRASYVDQYMNRTRLSSSAESTWVSIRNDLNTLARYYRTSWNWNQSLPPFSPWGGTTGGTTGGTVMDSRLTGTYRLNTTQSDRVSTVVDRYIGYYPEARRQNVRNNLERRLASPDMIAIEKTGNSVSMASTNAAQVDFQADGRARTETDARGRNITTTVTSDSRDGFNISYVGERTNDFFVAFEPMGNGQLRVTRRIYLEGRNDQITVQSVYDKVDNVARWSNVQNSTWGQNDPYPGTNNGAFVIPNNTTVTAALRTPIITGTSQVGDRISLEVTSPNQYRGAIIEGRVTEADKSGRISGRADISLDFDTIRMPNGQTYRFSGIIDRVTAANGDNVSVNNEGQVRDSNQTTKTVTRAGIGAALGAIIGAIVGGGQGAAIGAGIGAGAGAGTVLIQGRDKIELGEGSTFQITATSPANTPAYRP